MSNETKRDVFERALTEWCKLIFKIGGQGEEAYGYCEFDVTISKYEKDYDVALPDDLPVIPKAVGVSIKEQKAKQSLGGALFDAVFAANNLGRKKVGTVVNWMVDNDETYANAWLLGVWCVEETGEIVKLEDENNGESIDKSPTSSN